MWTSLRLTVLTPASCFRHCYGDSGLVHREFDVPRTAGPEHHGKRTGVQLGRARAIAKQSCKFLVWFVTDGATLHRFKLWNNVEGYVRFSWIISQFLFDFPVWNFLARTSDIHSVAGYQQNKNVYQNLKNIQFFFLHITCMHVHVRGKNTWIQNLKQFIKTLIPTMSEKIKNWKQIENFIYIVLKYAHEIFNKFINSKFIYRVLYTIEPLPTFIMSYGLFL